MSAPLPDDCDTDRPAAILRRHPELREIMAALRQHRRQQPVTVCCRTCGGPLSVTSVAEIGAVWVRCPPGCTAYRSRYTPDS